MYNLDVNNININDIKKQMSQKRFSHVESVVSKALQIVNNYNLDVKLKDVEFACWYHDYFKELSDEDIKKVSIDINLDTNKYSSNVIHGPLMAKYMKQLGFNDNIVSSIDTHTTLCSDPNIYQVITYVADFTNDLREGDNFAEARLLLNNKSLIDICFFICEKTNKFLKSRNQIIDKNSIEFIKWYEENNDSDNSK